jgi:hypothetical protein
VLTKWMSKLPSDRCLLLGLLSVTASHPVFAGFCFQTSVCDTFASAELVFVGKAVDIRPEFDLRDTAVRQQLRAVHDDSSAEGFIKLKTFYLRVLPEPVRTEVERAVTRDQLDTAVNELSKVKKRVTFHVNQVYKGIAQSNHELDLFTSFTDCGIHFIKGETYLVYASKLQTGYEAGACSRTRRLSDAGEDLVYLQFMRRGVTDKGRLYGFVSSSEPELRRPLDWDRVPDPVPEVRVHLRTDSVTLEATTDKDGRFVFDGLPGGDFEVTISDSRWDNAFSKPRHVASRNERM